MSSCFVLEQTRCLLHWRRGQDPSGGVGCDVAALLRGDEGTSDEKGQEESKWNTHQSQENVEKYTAKPLSDGSWRTVVVLALKLRNKLTKD